MSDLFDWHDKNYSFFQNSKCEFFPCHECEEKENFSCLFCYCPLYALGPKCGGRFTYNESGIKCCDGCDFPHKKENYGAVMDRISELIEMVKR